MNLDLNIMMLETHKAGSYLNFGTGEAGGGSQDSPIANSLVSALATALAAGEGILGEGGICCPRLWRVGEPTQSYKGGKLPSYHILNS